MEQQNNTAALNDSAGVLPMDTGVPVNGTHDESDHTPSTNGVAKKGRGRPPKSAGLTKVVKPSDTSKRGRGRPAKAVEISSPTKEVTISKPRQEEISTNGGDDDASKKKRGRPSKGTTSTQQTNGINKPQVAPAPVAVSKEQDNGHDSAKKKRGRPAGTSPKKTVVIETPSPPVTKEASPVKKRGRPSGTASVKKVPLAPKAPASTDGAAKKRGRPKKSATTSTPTAAVSTSAIEPATVTPNNV